MAYAAWGPNMDINLTWAVFQDRAPALDLPVVFSKNVVNLLRGGVHPEATFFLEFETFNIVLLMYLGNFFGIYFCASSVNCEKGYVSLK